MNNMPTYEIKHVMDHYEIYIHGRFYCSADTMSEATREVEKALYTVYQVKEG